MTPRSPAPSLLSPLLLVLRIVAVLATALLLGSPPAARGAAAAHEPFATYNLDQNLGNAAQPAPPESTGILDYTSSNLFLVHHARAGSLAFGALQTSGGSLHLATGGVPLNASLHLDAGGPFAPWLSSGKVGRDGTTLWFSVLIRQVGNRADGGTYFALRDGGASRFQVGQAYGTTRFTAGQLMPPPSLDENVHLVVARITYQAGNDAVSVWWDPDPAAGPGQAATVNYAANLTFDNLQFQGQWNDLYVDEIRFGSSWTDVAPTVATYTLTASAGPNGSLFQSPDGSSFTTGSVVYLEANAAPGYRFAAWTGDVSAGATQSNPLQVTMDRNRSLTATFEPGATAFFNIGLSPEPAAEPDLLSLRSLNETVAGQSGRVTVNGGSFTRGDGQPLRFWGVTAGVPSPAQTTEMLRFLSRRGVNLVRWHTSLYQNGAASMSAVNGGAIDDAHRLAAAAATHGIYTKLSYFFILGLRINPAWGVDGYTSDWIAANPGPAGEAPFGLQFFDPTFQAAIRSWLTELLTRPNPYHPQNLPLGQDPAVAILELQNEDNLFFWTFDPARFPPSQRNRLFGLFGDWLTTKYGSIAAAQAAWGWSQSNINDGKYAADNPGAGRMAVLSSWYMTGGFNAGAAETARIADQIQFLARLQYDFYARLRDHVRNTIGSPVALSASNWKTADDARLLDVEYQTYTAADIIDTHNYFAPAAEQKAIFTDVSGGDRLYAVPGISNPRTLPTLVKHVENVPYIMSEFAWTRPRNDTAEATLLTAAHASFSDLDGLMWFAIDQGAWQDGTRTWEVANPAIGGLFPAAALIYRRGDVATGQVVVREGRTLPSMGLRQNALFFETRGWDSTRDPTGEFVTDPSTGGGGSVDTLAAWVGRAVIRFDTDADEVASTALETNIDYTARTVRSIGGELFLDWGTAPGTNPPSATPGTGWFRLDTPRAQGFAGWLGSAGPLQSANTRVELDNDFGSVVAVSLDDQPLATSTRILIQAGTRERLRQEQRSAVTMTYSGDSVVGERIDNVGSLPWQMDGIDGAVTFVGTRRITRARAADEYGNALRDLPVPPLSGSEQRLILPPDALYTVVELSAAPAAPTITPAGGTFTSPLLVTLTGPAGTTVRYTLDGSEPSASHGLVASGPVAILRSGTLKAVAIDAGGTAGAPAQAAFTLPEGNLRLSNISTRARPGPGEQVLIAGFVVAGAPGGAKPVLVRGVGPSLASQGLSGFLANPLLGLFQGATPLGSNDDWGTAPSPAAITSAASQLGAAPLLQASADAAMLGSLAPGAYTLIIDGPPPQGIALAEVYDGDGPAGMPLELVNLSSRAMVGTGDDIAIAGFVVVAPQGPTATRPFLVRVVGPGLGGLGVQAPLSDPVLTLVRQSDGAVIGSNDDWGGDALLDAAASAVGAFPLSSGSADAALLINLPAGVYTLLASGKGASTGVALLEVYRLL